MVALLEARISMMPLHGSSDLPRARSLLITMALRREPERLLFIDSDIVPTAAQLVELATSPLVTPEQALTGLYPIRDTRARVGGGAAWAVDAVEPETAEGKPVFAAHWAGLGFAAVHADSLRRVSAEMQLIDQGVDEPWFPFCVPAVVGTTYYPDDRVLWERLRLTGTNLLASAALKVGHVAQVVLSEAC